MCVSVYVCVCLFVCVCDLNRFITLFLNFYLVLSLLLLLFVTKRKHEGTNKNWMLIRKDIIFAPVYFVTDDRRESQTSISEIESLWIMEELIQTITWEPRLNCNVMRETVFTPLWYIFSNWVKAECLIESFFFRFSCMLRCYFFAVVYRANEQQ